MSKVLRIGEGAKKLLYSYAQMYVYGMISIESGNNLIPTDYREFEKYGEFQCDTENGRIVIPPHSADYIRLSGLISGSGNVWCYISLYDENDNYITATSSLYQPKNSSYVSAPVNPRIVKIPNKAKSYYVKMQISAYNNRFYLNEGFGNKSTYMCVEKII